MARHVDCNKCYHSEVCAYRMTFKDTIMSCNEYTPTADVEEVVKCGKVEHTHINRKRGKRMNTEKFNEIITHRIDRCLSVLCNKADEYATEDRLHNFKVAARLQNCTPVSALAGMMCKHTVSVYDLIRDFEKGKEIPIEMWDEKIGDSINYLLLLTALINEQKESGDDA